MKADGDLPGCTFEADSFDNPLNRGDPLHGIELLPFDGSQLLCLNLGENRIFNVASGERFGRTYGPALPLRIEANIIRISAVELSRIGIHHSCTAGFAIEQPAQQGVMLVSLSAGGKRRRVLQERLYPFPRSNVDDGAVFSGI